VAKVLNGIHRSLTVLKLSGIQVRLSPMCPKCTLCVPHPHGHLTAVPVIPPSASSKQPFALRLTRSRSFGESDLSILSTSIHASSTAKSFWCCTAISKEVMNQSKQSSRLSLSKTLKYSEPMSDTITRKVLLVTKSFATRKPPFVV
jgi:hypothetical protein